MIPKISLLTRSVPQFVESLCSLPSENNRALVWGERAAGALAASLSCLIMCALQEVHVISGEPEYQSVGKEKIDTGLDRQIQSAGQQWSTEYRDHKIVFGHRYS